MADYSQHTQHVFVQPLNTQEYNIIPVYVTNQFSLECINQHLETINAFLASNSQSKCLKRSSLFSYLYTNNFTLIIDFVVILLCGK